VSAEKLEEIEPDDEEIMSHGYRQTCASNNKGEGDGIISLYDKI